MHIYELVILLHPDLEIDVDAPVKKIEKLIDGAGGKVVKRDNWGKRRLAYRVNHQDFAVYIFFELQVNPDKVRSLEHSILLAEEIMRHLIVAQEVSSAKSTKSNSSAADKDKGVQSVKKEPSLTPSGISDKKEEENG